MRILGVIGGAPGKQVTAEAEDKLKSLTNLLGSDDDFKALFATTNKRSTKPIRDKSTVEALLETNRSFMVKGVKHNYNDKEGIFYMTEPTTERHQSRQCSSCLFEFESSKQMNYCQFCGYANCKNCFKKTRAFIQQKNPINSITQSQKATGLMKLIEDHKEKQSIVKGKICLLCDRKFILHKSLFKTVATLDAQKLALQAVDKQHESMKKTFD